MMVSQRWAVKEEDCYSASAAKFLALTPDCCANKTTDNAGRFEKNVIMLSKFRQKGNRQLLYALNCNDMNWHARVSSSL